VTNTTVTDLESARKADPQLPTIVRLARAFAYVQAIGIDGEITALVDAFSSC
jgi:hypothetical protein